MSPRPRACGRQGAGPGGGGSIPHERNHGAGDHPIPSRTRQLSPASPKVLRRQVAGGQGVPLMGDGSGPAAGPGRPRIRRGSGAFPLFGSQLAHPEKPPGVFEATASRRQALRPRSAVIMLQRWPPRLRLCGCDSSCFALLTKLDDSQPSAPSHCSLSCVQERNVLEFGFLCFVNTRETPGRAYGLNVRG